MMSPVAVLTFHRCINYGSYWQARCLVEGLRARGRDAVLLDHRSSRIDRAEWRCALRPVPGAWGEREDQEVYAAKARKFFAAFRSLPLSREFALDDPVSAGHFELALIGSDEVWNLRHPWYGGKDLFYGKGLHAEHRASYAASFGNQSSAGKLEGRWSSQLRDLDGISVRDANSRRIVRAAIGQEPALVLDPVLLFPQAVEPAPVHAEGGYIALYGHSFPDWVQVGVRAAADRAGHSIVSIGYRNWWADEHRIEAGPHEFAGLIAGAQAVVTNFFHGCVFALINAKPFAAVPSDYRFNKVHDLLEALGAQSHLLTQATDPGAYDRMLSAPLSPAIAGHIAEMRAVSKAYLDDVLG